MLYFQASQEHEEDDIYQDISDPDNDVMAVVPAKSVSENDNEMELFSTAESSQNDVTENDGIVMTDTQNEIIEEEMKDVMEKLDQDLHRITQMSDEIGRAIAVSESQSTGLVQEDAENQLKDFEGISADLEILQDETNEPDIENGPEDQKEETFDVDVVEVKEKAIELVEEAPGEVLMQEQEETENVSQIDQELVDQSENLADQPEELPDQSKHLPDQSGQLPNQPEELQDQLEELPDQSEELPDQLKELPGQPEELPDQSQELLDQSEPVYEDYENTNVLIDDVSTAVPIAVEEDDEFNNIDYIDDDEYEDEYEEEYEEDVAGAISDENGSVEDVQRPFSADIFERHVQQVIEEDFPDSQDAKAPAVQIISSKLNQVMSREVVTTKSTPEVVLAPYEVIVYKELLLSVGILFFKCFSTAQSPPIAG